MFVFKALACALSFVLTAPQIYQTTLITLTFVALARGHLTDELHLRRHPLHVFILACTMSVAIPLATPLLLFGAPLCAPFSRNCLGVHNYTLIVITCIDFCQTLVLLPLSFVILFVAATPSDILVNMVAAQVFATLDDDFVAAFANPAEAKMEALGTYCKKKYKDDDEAAAAAEEENKENEEWEGARARAVPLSIKGALCCVFSTLSLYIVYDGWDTMDFVEMRTFKLTMFGLAVVLLIPQVSVSESVWRRSEFFSSYIPSSRDALRSN